MARRRSAAARMRRRIASSRYGSSSDAAFLDSRRERRHRAFEGREHESQRSFDGDRRQAERGAIEPGVLRFAWHVRKRPRAVVLPAVARAADPSVDTEGETRGRIAVDQPRAAMPADVAKAADRAVRPAHQQRRAAEEIETDRRARRRQIRDVADELPARQQDALPSRAKNPASV